MTERDSVEAAPDGFTDLPLQPTGSGIADLEIAYEQMKLSEAADQADAPVDPRGEEVPVGRDDARTESEAHPS